jgi:hypothetical protein
MHRHSAVQSPSGRGMCRITVEVPIRRILQGTVSGQWTGKPEKEGKEEKGRGIRKNSIALLTSLLFDRILETRPYGR